MIPTLLRNLARTLLFGLVLPLSARTALGLPSPAAPDEYLSKAVFLHNCCHFIDWPQDAFVSPASPITIAVFGEDPFGRRLDALTQYSTIRGRPIRILRTRRIEDARRSHLLFISQSEVARLNVVLAAVRGCPIVTVGESDAFLAAGGMIALKAEQTMVRLRINTTMVKAAKVTISSKLLRIATQR